MQSEVELMKTKKEVNNCFVRRESETDKRLQEKESLKKLYEKWLIKIIMTIL